MIRVMGALRDDVDHLVEDDAGDGDGHQVDALLAVAAERGGKKHLGETVAVNVDEWVDNVVIAWHPAQRSRDSGVAVKDFIGMDGEPAVSVEIDGDRIVDCEAGSDFVTAQDLDGCT